MPDCFISYRRTPSAATAMLIQARLSSDHGIDAYVDTTRTDSTKVQFPDRLMQAIGAAPVFVCVLGQREGEHTLESEWVQREIYRAFELRKFCVPIFQESYTPIKVSNAAIDYLLSFDGVHIFDEKNVMIDASIKDIAELIKPHRASRMAGLNRSIVYGLIGVALLLIVALAAVALSQSSGTASDDTGDDGRIIEPVGDDDDSPAVITTTDPNDLMIQTATPISATATPTNTPAPTP